MDTAATFRTTQWSVVLTAQQSDPALAHSALEKLSRTYWTPLYAFVRRRGYSTHDAQDLTQDFFARLLQKNALDQVDPAKGKFRSFLLASMNHFLANEWDKANAQKRGGGRQLFPIDLEVAESLYTADFTDNETAEKCLDRRWATTVLDQVLQRLQDDYAREQKADLFEQLKPTLAGTRESEAYSRIAGRLGMTDGAVKTAVHRLRHRYRELLRARIAETVASPAEIEEELRSLFAAVQ